MAGGAGNPCVILARDPIPTFLPTPIVIPKSLAELKALIQHTLRQRRVRLGLAAAAMLFGLWWLWPLFGLLDKGAQVGALVRLAPAVLGLTGPKTFLVLVQNDDELRPTGGYLTAAGTMTVSLGRVSGLDLEDTSTIQEPNLVYPPPPDPIARYLDVPAWYFRDANWSPDFPTTAQTAATLYTLANPRTFDGVIALDQAALRILLEATGPVRLSGLPGTITAENVQASMRAARDPAPGAGVSYDWWLQRKDFIPKMAKAIFRQLVWTRVGSLLQAAIRVLDERHVTLWLRDAGAAAVLADHGWDGALRPGDADYVMLVEANLGYNKVNAVTHTQLRYQVNLAAEAPTGRLSVTQTNPAQGSLPCVPGPDYGTGTYLDLITRCYWNYLRVYVPLGATLISATPHATPGAWLLTGQDEAGAVTITAGERGTQAFGTLLVVPFNTTLFTTFEFTLAPGVVRADGDEWVYRLRFQKQAGTLAVPLVLEVQLPLGAQVVSGPLGGVMADGVWTYGVWLRQDVDVEVRYRLK